MKTFCGSWLVSILVLLSVSRTANSQDTGKQMLRLAQTISMPNVKGSLVFRIYEIRGDC